MLFRPPWVETFIPGAGRHRSNTPTISGISLEADNVEVGSYFTFHCSQRQVRISPTWPPCITAAPCCASILTVSGVTSHRDYFFDPSGRCDLMISIIRSPVVPGGKKPMYFPVSSTR